MTNGDNPGQQKVRRVATGIPMKRELKGYFHVAHGYRWDPWDGCVVIFDSLTEGRTYIRR
jgi:hypothetical protein